MIEAKDKIENSSIGEFERKFFTSEEDFTFIGHGSIGGKAKGLARIKSIINTKLSQDSFPGITISIPRLTVLTTSVFDEFMSHNKLFEVAYSDANDNVIANEFQKASLPTSMIGDLRALINEVTTPLAIRSSSLLEDAMYEPFAGIYETKMIPNNQLDSDSRFRKLTEAIKFVYSSTFFKQAKDYIKATNNKIENEKMAVIIQEVVGNRYGDKYYPIISGVGRSFNFYPMGNAKPEEGVVNLALGLGKTIVDGGTSWTFSPAHPKAKPPFGSINVMLDETQRTFWSVNMGKPPAYDPTKETEYLNESEISSAEEDGTMRFIASTYDSGSDRIIPGTSVRGPRVINFTPIIDLNLFPLNKLVKKILQICEEASGAAVEIEFAVTFDRENILPARFGFLQVRPMVVSTEQVEITQEDLTESKVLLSSGRVLGNGIVKDITDIVFVKPVSFDPKHTSEIAKELEEINDGLQKSNTKYLLIGFGRWGSSDPWLGIPVNWGQISKARVIVESMLPNMNVELSQGSHFFHNITGFQVLYFSLKEIKNENIDWKWLDSQITVNEKKFIKHVKLQNSLLIKADGRRGIGVVLR